MAKKVNENDIERRIRPPLKGRLTMINTTVYEVGLEELRTSFPGAFSLDDIREYFFNMAGEITSDVRIFRVEED